jgi:tRNA (guanine26-N2/guanine27-N2)-dimethyltransferase
MSYQEGKVKLNIDNIPKTVHAGMEIFINPEMKTNRDVSISLLKYFLEQRKNPIIALPLAGSGIRALRILHELNITKQQVYTNDSNKSAVKFMKSQDLIKVTNHDARIFMLQKKYDYIDIDPFGSPVPFADIAVQQVKHKGILAITATDTAPLSGTYPVTCKRRYAANPHRGSIGHETGRLL